MFLRFGDVGTLDSPNIFNGVISLNVFSNSLDLHWYYQVNEVEGISNVNDETVQLPTLLPETRVVVF